RRVISVSPMVLGMSQLALRAAPRELRDEQVFYPAFAWQAVVGWGLVAVAACAVFMLQWWNRYLSPTVGGELFFVSATARGDLPYRDYFFPGQPGMVLTSVLISKWFGPRLIVFWALGVVLRLAAAGCLYWWLAKWFRPALAAAAVILTFIISSADIADFPAF